jgi:uncharacterized membrane protein YhaH (DUF805 family)
MQGIIEIDAITSEEAAIQILRHLNQARADGWTIGNSFALIQGWRNEYHIIKDDQKAVLVFDMRPTLRNVRSRSELATITMAVAAAHRPEDSSCIPNVKAAEQGDVERLSSDSLSSGSDKEFYLYWGERQTGPHKLDELRTFAKQAAVKSSDLIWREGWDGWRRVSEVPGVMTPVLPINPRYTTAAKAQSATKELQSDPEAWMKQRVKELETTPTREKPSTTVPLIGESEVVSTRENTDNRVANEPPRPDNAAKQKTIAPETNRIGLHLFKPHGRIGRVCLLVRSLIFILFFFIPLINFVFLYLFIVSAIKRLHDFNFRGWWLLLFIPAAIFVSTFLYGRGPETPTQSSVNTFFSLALLLALIPGTRGENRFGPAPRQRNEKGKRVYE